MSRRWAGGRATGRAGGAAALFAVVRGPGDAGRAGLRSGAGLRWITEVAVGACVAVAADPSAAPNTIGAAESGRMDIGCATGAPCAVERAAADAVGAADGERPPPSAGPLAALRCTTGCTAALRTGPVEEAVPPSCVTEAGPVVLGFERGGTGRAAEDDAAGNSRPPSSGAVADVPTGAEGVR
jgi:hypothetical protein